MMVDETRAEDTGNTGKAGGGTGEPGTGPEGTFRDGVRQGLGVLSAFKEALEETIQEARQRGELSSDRAREVVRGAMARAKEAAGEARERLDAPSQEEFDRLRGKVDELRVRLENLEARTAQHSDVGPSQPAGKGEDDVPAP